MRHRFSDVLTEPCKPFYRCVAPRVAVHLAQTIQILEVTSPTLLTTMPERFRNVADKISRSLLTVNS